MCKASRIMYTELSINASYYFTGVASKAGVNLTKLRSLKSALLPTYSSSFNLCHVSFYCVIQVTEIIIAEDCALAFQEQYASSSQDWKFGYINFKKGLSEGDDDGTDVF